MIERIESLPETLEKSIFTARIEALLNTYRNSIGVELFTQTVKGELTAVFGGMDNSFTLICLNNADFDELNSYFSFCNAMVFCDGDVSERLNARRINKALLYEFSKEVKPTDFPYENGRGSITDVYRLLKKGTDGDIDLPPFEFWYTDFCLRFNHNSSEYFIVENAVAVAGFVTEGYSLITGVAVDSSDRKKGFGKTALSGLIHNIICKYPQSKIFASTVNAGGFYEALNFKHCGNVAVCEF